MKREASFSRQTKETDITASVYLDGTGKAEIQTPIGFFNHMLEALAKHGLFDICLRARGDLEVDQHHLLEDCGLVLGRTFHSSLKTKTGLLRTGYFVFPMDEALAVASVDLGGRPFLQYEASFARQFCGGLDTDLLEDFFMAFANSIRGNIVIRMPYGRSDHHKIEAVFKAFGKALRIACAVDPRSAGLIPSTKGMVDDDRNN